MKKVIGTAVMVVFLLGTFAVAEEGMYTGKSGFKADGTVYQVGENHVVWMGEFPGASFTSTGQGFLHNVSWLCFGFNDIKNGQQDAHGRCIITETDDDKMYAVWSAKGPAPRFDGHATFTGGTGKYVGLTGGHDFSCSFAANTLGHCDITNGKYKFP